MFGNTILANFFTIISFLFTEFTQIFLLSLSLSTSFLLYSAICFAHNLVLLRLLKHNDNILTKNKPIDENDYFKLKRIKISNVSSNSDSGLILPTTLFS